MASGVQSLGFGALSYDVAHLLGTLALVLSFVLLYQRRLAAVINVYALQAVVLAAAAAWQAWVQGAPHLYVTAVITIVAKAIAIPIGMHRMLREFRLHRTIEPALGIFPSMAIGVALVALFRGKKEKPRSVSARAAGRAPAARAAVRVGELAGASDVTRRVPLLTPRPALARPSSPPPRSERALCSLESDEGGRGVCGGLCCSVVEVPAPLLKLLLSFLFFQY